MICGELVLLQARTSTFRRTYLRLRTLPTTARRSGPVTHRRTSPTVSCITQLRNLATTVHHPHCATNMHVSPLWPYLATTRIATTSFGLPCTSLFGRQAIRLCGATVFWHGCPPSKTKFARVNSCDGCPPSKTKFELVRVIDALLAKRSLHELIRVTDALLC
jgi:hypothetical protein